MATIKLKHTSASLLLKRLSSYALDNPLYKALKEFGRIIKSIFILTYFDDLELRQKIEKQLNKIESSNKFGRAVYFARNQEFKDGTKEEQDISVNCMMLIQNIIVLWNYLFLSKLLLQIEDDQKKKQMAESIKHGSVVCWQHINFHGEYDFTKVFSNETLFDIDKIMSLET
jgi:TnpA family transposase